MEETTSVGQHPVEWYPLSYRRDGQQDENSSPGIVTALCILRLVYTQYVTEPTITVTR